MIRIYSTYFFVSSPKMKKQCIICPINNCWLNDDTSVIHCPINKFLRVTGGKRSMIVLLVLSKPHRFGELKRNIPDITEKVLITTLRWLEKAGMIHRQATLGKHLQTIYSLSPLGAKVQKISHSMADIGKWL